MMEEVLLLESLGFLEYASEISKYLQSYTLFHFIFLVQTVDKNEDNEKFSPAHYQLLSFLIQNSVSKSQSDALPEYLFTSVEKFVRVCHKLLQPGILRWIHIRKI